MSRLPKNITEKQLYCILDNLYYARSDGRSVSRFDQLRIIQNGMNALKHIVIDDHILLEYTVHHVLNALIEKELQQQRYVLNIPHRPFLELKTRQQALAGIQQDALTQSNQLIGWSLLYHIYFRREFNITLSLFAELIHVENRTLRRYKSHAVSLLLRSLLAAELQLSH